MGSTWKQSECSLQTFGLEYLGGILLDTKVSYSRIATLNVNFYVHTTFPEVVQVSNSQLSSQSDIHENGQRHLLTGHFCSFYCQIEQNNPGGNCDT